MPPVKCPECGNRHRARQRDLGHTVVCPACKFRHKALTGRGWFGDLFWPHHLAGLVLGLLLAATAMTILCLGLSTAPLFNGGVAVTPVIPRRVTYLSVPIAIAGVLLVRRWARPPRTAGSDF